MSLYDKYGGFAAVSTVVHTFYDKVVASPRLDRYFADVDMAKLIDHQTTFLCKVLGGPDNYNGRALRAGAREPKDHAGGLQRGGHPAPGVPRGGRRRGR